MRSVKRRARDQARDPRKRQGVRALEGGMIIERCGQINFPVRLSWWVCMKRKQEAWSSGVGAC